MICLTQFYCINPLVITDYAVLPPIKDFSVANKDEAWLVSQNGKIFHFINGGQKIEEVEFTEKIVQIYFLNVNEGWALEEGGQLWATSSGGKDWTKKAILTTESPALHSSEMVFADNRVGWLIGSSTIWLTQDGGESWNMVYPTERFSYQTLDGQPISISGVDSDAAWVGFSNGAVLKTIDRGKSWEQIKSPGKYDLQALYAFSADECFVSGWNRGGLFHTINGGKDWRQSVAPEIRRKSGLWSISFINKQVGWAAGLNFVTNTDNPETDIDLLLKTTDGGKTWTTIETAIKEDTLGFVIVKFTDEKHGWLTGYQTIYRTADGGRSWNKMFEVENPNRRAK